MTNNIVLRMQEIKRLILYTKCTDKILWLKSMNIKTKNRAIIICMIYTSDKIWFLTMLWKCENPINRLFVRDERNLKN